MEEQYNVRNDILSFKLSSQQAVFFIKNDDKTMHVEIHDRKTKVLLYTSQKFESIFMCSKKTKLLDVEFDENGFCKTLAFMITQHNGTDQVLWVIQNPLTNCIHKHIVAKPDSYEEVKIDQNSIYVISFKIDAAWNMLIYHSIYYIKDDGIRKDSCEISTLGKNMTRFQNYLATWDPKVGSVSLRRKCQLVSRDDDVKNHIRSFSIYFALLGDHWKNTFVSEISSFDNHILCRVEPSRYAIVEF
jgi:hypothetical protein